jgi:hypothetical protein
MARRRMTPPNRRPKNVMELNVDLLDALMRYLIAKPQMFDLLPEKIELVILPDDDPGIRLFNLELLDRYNAEAQPVVFARLKSSKAPGLAPSLYVPLAT